MATWFEQLTGCDERSYSWVHKNIAHEHGLIVSHLNGRSIVCGGLEVASLAELRTRVLRTERRKGVLRVRQLVSDVRQLHADPTSEGSLFQVASQFNLLEMASPFATPEMGVGIYENDPTQGPACAVAAGAGTVYRNYFVSVHGQIGQTAENQIDCLADLGAALGNTGGRLWQMKNGYALPTESGLAEISRRLAVLNEAQLDELRSLLRIGLQWNTPVTLAGCRHLVSQAYCSALPIAYSALAPALWEPFARLVLEALYEATLCAAVLNADATGVETVYLTAVGGGAFGNPDDWILSAMERALQFHRGTSLDVAIVSYRSPDSAIGRLVSRF